MIFTLMLISLAYSCLQVPLLWQPGNLPLKTDDPGTKTRKCQARLARFSGMIADSNWKDAYTDLVDLLIKFEVDERPLAVDLSQMDLDGASLSEQVTLLNFGQAFHIAQTISDLAFARVLENPSKEEVSKVLELAHVRPSSISDVCSSEEELADRWGRICSDQDRIRAAYEQLSAGELYFLSRNEIDVCVKIARTSGEPLEELHGSATRWARAMNFPVELAPLRAFLCIRFQVECQEMYGLATPIRAASTRLGVTRFIERLYYLRLNLQVRRFTTRLSTLARSIPDRAVSLGLEWEWKELVGCGVWLDPDLKLMKMFEHAEKWPMFMRMFRRITLRGDTHLGDVQRTTDQDIDMIVSELRASQRATTKLFVEEVQRLCADSQYVTTATCLDLQVQLEIADLRHLPSSEREVNQKARDFVTGQLPTFDLQPTLPAQRTERSGVVELQTVTEEFVQAKTMAFHEAGLSEGELCPVCLEEFHGDLPPCEICPGSHGVKHWMCGACARKHILGNLERAAWRQFACAICRRQVHLD